MKDISQKTKTNGNEKSLKRTVFQYALEKKKLQFFVVINFFVFIQLSTQNYQKPIWKNETVKDNRLLDHK